MEDIWKPLESGTSLTLDFPDSLHCLQSFKYCVQQIESKSLGFIYRCLLMSKHQRESR